MCGAHKLFIYDCTCSGKLPSTFYYFYKICPITVESLLVLKKFSQCFCWKLSIHSLILISKSSESVFQSDIIWHFSEALSFECFGSILSKITLITYYYRFLSFVSILLGKRQGRQANVQKDRSRVITRKAATWNKKAGRLPLDSTIENSQRCKSVYILWSWWGDWEQVLRWVWRQGGKGKLWNDRRVGGWQTNYRGKKIINWL